VRRSSRRRRCFSACAPRPGSASTPSWRATVSTCWLRTAPSSPASWRTAGSSCAPFRRAAGGWRRPSPGWPWPTAWPPRSTSRSRTETRDRPSPEDNVDSIPHRRRAVALALTASLAAASGAIVRAQAPPSPKPAVPTFGISTELVYVRFHVERKKGEYLAGLKPDQIRVLEDGKPQPVALLETPSTRERTVPPQVTLALDVSSSVMDAQLLDESLLREVLLA